MRRRIILESGVKTEKVTVQVTMSDGASAQGITVTINGSATTTNADGLAYGDVPYDTNYSVVFSQKDSTYSTPATQSFTANQDDRTVTATYTKYYETCTVTSNLSTTITINNNSKSNTTSHSVSVPYGTVYTVSVGDKTNYNKPSNKTYTASTSSKSVTMNYTAKTESVTVYTNVNATITINGSSKSNTTSYTTTVPYGTAYCVYVSGDGTCSGPTYNQGQCFTANTSSRRIDAVFTCPPILYIIADFIVGDGSSEDYDFGFQLNFNGTTYDLYYTHDNPRSYKSYKVILTDGTTYTNCAIRNWYSYTTLKCVWSGAGGEVTTYSDGGHSFYEPWTAESGEVYYMYLEIYGR